MYFYDQCNNPVYFNSAFLVIYFSVIETLIHHRKIEFNPFRQNDAF